jgi:inositol-pentakisphosphate 2-kinase
LKNQQPNIAPHSPDSEVKQQNDGAPGMVAEHYKATSQLLALPLSVALGIIRDYLIAATAKDCSIIIACRHCPESIPSNDDLHFNFQYQVKVADLDLKASSKIVTHMEVDAKIVATHRSLQGEGLA